jgi:hypothetical protein
MYTVEPAEIVQAAIVSKLIVQAAIVSKPIAPMGGKATVRPVTGEMSMAAARPTSVVTPTSGMAHSAKVTTAKMTTAKVTTAKVTTAKVATASMPSASMPSASMS